MKKSHLLLLLFPLFLGFISAGNKAKPKRVVIIGLDGLSMEGFQKAKHPNLDKLLADGILSLKTRPVMPSVTLPNWTSHLTSGGPEQHGVTGNDWTIDKHQLNPIESDDEGYYPSIFKTVKEQIPGVKTAFYYNWANLINSINQKYLDEVSFEENDSYVNNYNKAFDFAVENKSNPTLIFLYSVHIDHTGHQHNWMSPEYIAAIEAVDVEIGNFINKFKNAGLYDNTNFLLITDHGGVGNGHGGTSMAEMEVPWAITGPGVKERGILKTPNSNANTATVIAHIFGCKDLPKSEIGRVPDGIFKK